MAKLTGFPGTETAPNWQAAAEQIGILKAFEDGTVTSVLTALRAADYACTLEASNNTSPKLFDGSDGVPRYLMFYHDGQYWLQILGTYTARQWLANALGAVLQSNFPLTDQKFQSAWLKMATTIADTVKVVVAGETNPQINICGHSLGGAVAYDVAILLKASHPFWPVRLMTFGSPRPARGEYLGTLPSFHYDVQTSKDNVVSLPPNLPLTTGAKWQLQGNPSVVRENGSLAASDFNAGELDIKEVKEWGVYPHQLYAYVKFLLNRYDLAFPAHPSDPLLIALNVIPGKKVPPELAPLPPAITIPFQGNPQRRPSPPLDSITC